jgi:hypothetical protein
MRKLIQAMLAALLVIVASFNLSISPANAQVNSQSYKPLLLYWNSERGDNFTTTKERAGTPGDGTASDVSYTYAQNEACILSSKQSGTSALNLYWSDKRQDNFSTATAIGQQSAVDAGYRYVGIDGYIFTNQIPGTVPLNLYWNSQREDNMTVASAVGIKAAKDAGYSFARTEGYVYPAEQCQ